MEITGPWDRERVDEFLDEARVPVRLGCRTRATRRGSSRCGSRGTARSTARRARAPTSPTSSRTTITFPSRCRRTNPPYKGVRGRGHATVTPDADKELLRARCWSGTSTASITRPATGSFGRNARRYGCGSSRAAALVGLQRADGAGRALILLPQLSDRGAADFPSRRGPEPRRPRAAPSRRGRA